MAESSPAVLALEKQAISPVWKRWPTLTSFTPEIPPFRGFLLLRLGADASRCALIDSFIRPLNNAGFPPSCCSLRTRKSGGGGKVGGYLKPDLAVGNSFAATEGLAAGLPLTELGFPSYGHHCLSDEPFFGFAGARMLAGRLFNSLRSENPGR